MSMNIIAKSTNNAVAIIKLDSVMGSSNLMRVFTTGSRNFGRSMGFSATLLVLSSSALSVALRASVSDWSKSCSSVCCASSA